MNYVILYQHVHDPIAPWQLLRCAISQRCYFTRREAEYKGKELLHTGKAAIVRLFDRDQLIQEWKANNE